MKIAIQGHPIRGKEVIHILENLGGINTNKYSGNYSFTRHDIYYYITENNKITYDSINILTSDKYKFYTLEEFEKEFPFKIGDKVVWNKDNYTAVRTVLRINYSDLAGIKYAITAFGAANCFWEVDVNELKSYKEMQKERNITLTLDKAKEWYKKGGELKEIALQAFTEKELIEVELPKTWEEFCENFPVKKGECFFELDDEICVTSLDGRKRTNKDWITSKKSAEAHLAMIQLEQLRDCWRQGWKPTEYNTRYCITNYSTRYVIMSFRFISFLSFPTEKMAEEFLKCFRDLIEKAGDLI